MLRRILLIAALCAILILALRGCSQGPESYYDLRVQMAGGRPYLLLQNCSYPLISDELLSQFSIYTPRGKDLDDWEPVLAERLGPASGIFRLPASSPEAGEELGLFHKGRATIFNPAGKPPSTGFITLPFKWVAETAVQFNGCTYAFGVEMSRNSESEPPQPNETLEGVLRAARYDGQAWEELKIDGPKASFGRDGFSLDAVALNGGVKIFWRKMAFDQLIHPFLEGPRAVTQGDLYAAGFDGQAFTGKTARITGLPRGNLDIWADERGGLKFLVQSYSRPGDSAFSNGALVVMAAPPEENNNAEAPVQAAQLVETVSENAPQAGSRLFGFICARRINWGGREYILRSNWQTFEVWSKTDEHWTLSTRYPKGLPVYNLETILASILLMGLGLLAFGTGLAYQRRNANWKSEKKIRARDIYGTLSARMGAYAIDLTIILTAAILFSQQFGGSYPPVQSLLENDFLQLPYAPLFIFYIVYLAVSEWLWGASLGKYILGLRVIMSPSRKLTLWAALVRNLIGFYERLPMAALFVSVPMFIFTPRRQRLGDLLARTYVVHKASWEAFNLQRAEELAAKGEEYERFSWEEEEKL